MDKSGPPFGQRLGNHKALLNNAFYLSPLTFQLSPPPSLPAILIETIPFLTCYQYHCANSGFFRFNNPRLTKTYKLSIYLFGRLGYSHVPMKLSSPLWN